MLTGQHEVQDDQIVFALFKQLEHFLTRLGAADFESLLDEVSLDEFAYLRIVINDQQSGNINIHEVIQGSAIGASCWGRPGSRRC